MAALAAAVMDEVINLLWFRLDTFILIMLRVGALFMSSPVFGSGTLPVRFRVGFSVVLAYVITRSYGADISLGDINIIAYAGMCITEVLFGVVMGWTTTLFFATVYIGGQLIDMQLGFGMVNIFDPQTNMQVPIFGAFFNVLLMLVFLSVNGHHRLIQILVLTIERIPPGTASLNPQIGMVAVEVFTNVFVLALNMAMPILATMFLLEVAMGIIIRTVPQVNMFAIGFPLKIALGVIMVYVILPVFVQFSPNIFNGMYEAMDKMFTGLMSAT